MFHSLNLNRSNYLLKNAIEFKMTRKRIIDNTTRNHLLKIFIFVNKKIRSFLVQFFPSSHKSFSQ